MGICPNCGSWVDEGDICMSCGGSYSYSYDDEEDDDSYAPSDEPMPIELSNEAWNLYLDFKEELALIKINEALEHNDKDYNNWNRKAIILEALNRYAESEECYDRSLELSPHKLVFENKARMLYDWAYQLLEESKEMSNGLFKLEGAKEVIQRAINSIPKVNSEENINKYLDLKDSIDYYINYEETYQDILKSLKQENEDDLFTITGMMYYESDVDLYYYSPLKLVKERDNEFDSDAIAVYADDKKIGYVANSADTKYIHSSSASQLQDKIPDVCSAKYLFHLERYEKINFHIGVINH